MVLNLSRKLYEMIDGELYEFDIGRFLWESSSTLVSSRGHKIRSVAFQKLYDPPLDAELNVDSKNGRSEGQF